ncbi:hypothetical protein HZS_1683 [Henneguya salminicola]|nr:hypothetical protein HZS_1683 [Henneguya salminicola]
MIFRRRQAGGYYSKDEPNFILYDGPENDGERFITFAILRQLIILSLISNICFVQLLRQRLQFSTNCLLFTENTIV